MVILEALNDRSLSHAAEDQRLASCLRIMPSKSALITCFSSGANLEIASNWRRRSPSGPRSSAPKINTSALTCRAITQKERDIETGLDYFLARYYSSTQGRFTGVDPFNIALETQKAAELKPEKARALFNAYLSQPQQWNRYSYAINNPLLYVDPDGEAIQLSNDKDERERQLQALREMVGSNAGAYLYANQGSDGNWYVGIYDQNPNGDTRSFEQVNEVAGELGAIVRDPEIAVLEFVPRGTRVTDDSGDWARIVEARRGAYRESPAATGYFNGVLKIKMLDWSKHSLGYLPGELMSDRKDNWLTASVMVGHELGHARARMTGYRDRRGNSDAIKGSLRLEEKVRKLQNPNGPRRERH
jgi:RHS repeat-associated protein